MRQKVLDYMKKPTDKARKQLTTMEQAWCDAQAKSSGGGKGKGEGKGKGANSEKPKTKKTGK